MSEFAFASDFTVGIEEELHLVDAETFELSPVASDVLARMGLPPDAAGHEAYGAQIELRSPPSSSVPDAAAALAALREAALEAGATLLGAGLHPSAPFGDAALVPLERYDRVAAEMRGLLRRTPEAALHVHVGMPDETTAVRVFNALRRQLPLLQGLSASSPWWFGIDSGLASARFALVRAYPGRGVPPALGDIGDAERLTRETLLVADAPEATFLWWDLRLHPRHGTVEVREMDSQASLDDVAGLAALVRALALEAAGSPAPTEEPSSDPLAWSSFRAARDGVEATILDDGALVPLRDVARRTVDRLRPLAREHGEADALDLIARILEQGGGAGRQRAAFARGGMHALLRALVEETARVGLDAARAGRARGGRTVTGATRRGGVVPGERPSVETE